jgi:hypothetical protein
MIARLIAMLSLVSVIVTPANAEDMNVLVQSGVKSQKIHFWGHCNGTTCAFEGYPEVKIVEPRTHGTVSFQQGRELPHFPPSSPCSRCNQVPAAVVRVFYSPQPGFVGTDYISTDTTFPDHRFCHDRFTITVSSSPATGSALDPRLRSGNPACDRTIANYLACFEGQNMASCVARLGRDFCQNERARVIGDIAIAKAFQTVAHQKLCQAQRLRMWERNKRGYAKAFGGVTR